MLPDAVLRRLVKEFSGLKRGAVEGRRKQKLYLKTLLTGLAACVSYFNPKAHAMLLAEIQGIPIWEADQVTTHLLSTAQCLHWNVLSSNWWLCDAPISEVALTGIL